MCLLQNRNFFAVSKDGWEDTGKSMKNGLYVWWYGKSTTWAEATTNSEKIKPVTYACLKASINQSVRQSVSHAVSQSV